MGSVTDLSCARSPVTRVVFCVGDDELAEPGTPGWCPAGTRPRLFLGGCRVLTPPGRDKPALCAAMTLRPWPSRSPQKTLGLGSAPATRRWRNRQGRRAAPTPSGGQPQARRPPPSLLRRTAPTRSIVDTGELPPLDDNRDAWPRDAGRSSKAERGPAGPVRPHPAGLPHLRPPLRIQVQGVHPGTPGRHRPRRTPPITRPVVLAVGP